MIFWGKEENRKVVLDQLKKYGFKLGFVLKILGFNLESGWGFGRVGLSYSMLVYVVVQMIIEQFKIEFDKLFEDLKEDDKIYEMELVEVIEILLFLY